MNKLIPILRYPEGSREQSKAIDDNFRALALGLGPYAVTADYTFKDNDTIDSLQVDATSGNLTITLPSPTGNRRRRIIKTDASTNTVTITAAPTTIIGSATYVLATQYAFVELEPTGTSWLVVSVGLYMAPTTGRVGIGTTAPTEQLHIKGPTPRIALEDTDSNGAINRLSANSATGDIGLQADVGSVAVGSIIFFDIDGARVAEIDANKNIVLTKVAIATNATDGFVYIPTCAGTPTGTPTAKTGAAPIVIDSTNNKLYFYSGGSWRDAGP